VILGLTKLVTSLKKENPKIGENKRMSEGTIWRRGKEKHLFIGNEDLTYTFLQSPRL